MSERRLKGKELDLNVPARPTLLPSQCMDKNAKLIEELVLAVHRRNGGKLRALDLNKELLDPTLGIDSLDLAEIVAAAERQCGISPFESSVPPRTWKDFVRASTARAE